MHHDSRVAEEHGSRAWMGAVGGTQTSTVLTTTVTYSGAQLGWENSSLGRNGLIIKCQVSAACLSGWVAAGGISPPFLFHFHRFGYFRRPHLFGLYSLSPEDRQGLLAWALVSQLIQTEEEPGVEAQG